MENDRYNFGKHYLVLDTKLENHINAKNNPHNVTKADVALSEVANRPLEDEVLEDSKNYVTSGAVYAVKEELESKIHGFLEFETFDEFPEIGVDNVIYIATDTNKQYR